MTQVINNAVDEVRRQEQKARPELKGTRYVWLKNQDNLTDRQAEILGPLVLPKLNLKTARAYQIKINFQELWEQEPQDAEAFLKKWYFWMKQRGSFRIRDAAERGCDLMSDAKNMKIRQKAPVRVTTTHPQIDDLSGTIPLRRPEERASSPTRIEFDSVTVEMIKRKGTWIY